MDITNEETSSQESESIPKQYVPTPDNPPWNSWIALAVWLLSVLFVLFIPLIFLAPYLLQQGINYSDSERIREFVLTDPTAVILQIAPMALIHALTLIVAWFVVTKFNKYSFRETLGWTMNGFKAWHAVVITVLFYAVALGLSFAFGDVENDFEQMLKSSRTAVLLIAFFATFTAPIVEEVVYRGLLYSAFQRRFGVVLGVIFASLLFTLVHVPQYSLSTTPDHATVLTLFLLSLTLTVLRAYTGSLLPCIVLHTIFNGMQSVLLIAEPYLKALDPVVEPTAATLLK